MLSSLALYCIGWEGLHTSLKLEDAFIYLYDGRMVGIFSNPSTDTSVPKNAPDAIFNSLKTKISWDPLDDRTACPYEIWFLPLPAKCFCMKACPLYGIRRDMYTYMFTS